MVRRRRGLSHLLAAIILIGIVIGLGALMYAWTTGLFRAKSKVAVANVKDISLIKTSDGSSAAFSITIENTGTVSISSVTITEVGNHLKDTSDNDLSITLNDIAPGKCKGENVELKAESVEFGKTYIIQVEVNFADGSSQKFTVSVPVEEV